MKYSYFKAFQQTIDNIPLKLTKITDLSESNNQSLIHVMTKGVAYVN